MTITNKYVIYDLETNGLDYYTTGIMQFTLLDIEGNVLLNQYVFPYNNVISGKEIHGIDLEVLNNNNATSTINLCKDIKNVIKYKFNKEKIEKIYWIAYNNFGFDQIILENNFKICNVKMPSNWYFIDLYPIIKEKYKYIKPNYKLKSVYEYFFGAKSTETLNFHCALTDTRCLHKIWCRVMDDLKIINQETFINKYTRPLLQRPEIHNTPVTTLNGYSHGIFFEAKGIYTIGDLYLLFKEVDFNSNNMDDLLRCKFNIYSDYYRNNLVKQLAIIHHLQ
jgi:DNA polymerase III epsilon subunit-like protein